MKRFFRLAACLTAAMLISFAAAAWLLLSGRINIKHLLYQLHYNPWITARQPIESKRLISTNVLKLRLHAYSLPSIKTQKPFISGGGAILPAGKDAILVLNKYGRLYRFRLTDNGPALDTLDDGVRTYNAEYLQYAKSQGYAVRPGTNVGYAGLGMRGIDLLHLKKHSMIALSYTQWQRDRHCMVNKVSVRPVDERMNFVPGTGWKEIFVSKPCIGLNPNNKRKPMAGHQTGGRMYELPDGRFLLSIGDIKHDGVNRKNILDDPNVDLGKIFIVDPLSGNRKLFNSGHRNPQGLTIARDGTIWETEHGPKGGDELNILLAGKNYGWPHVTMGRLCLTCPRIINGRHPGYFPPVFTWSPGLGISNLIEIRGVSKAWDGNLLVASLKNQSLHRLYLRDHHVIQDERIFIGERIRDLYQADNGDFVLWTDSGKIIFLSPVRVQTKAEKLIAALPRDVRDTIRGCQECHDFDPGLQQEDRIGLWGVYGRPIASTNYTAYSDALKSKGGKWNKETLNAFLRDPAAFAPDNAMGDNGVADDKTRARLIKFLKKLK